MKYSFKWLCEFVKIDLTPQQLADRLSLAGQEVEAVIPVGEKLSGIVVGKIEKIEKHPNADKLVVTQVFDGKERYQICTAATNVFEGAVIPVSLPGSVLNSGLQIKPAKLRGVDSNGMLCSEVELGVADESQGIWILPNDTPLGIDFIDYAHLKDTILDIAILPNRGDCQSIYGMAREVAAILNLPLKKPDCSINAAPGDSDISVEIADKEGCPHYTGRLIKTIKQNPTPLWMKRKLQLSGIRPISLIVDITNYVLLELGQPLHAFDRKSLGNKIVVRRANASEKMVTLDGDERTLSPEILLICDGDRPVAAAGVMGAKNSEINDGTTDVFLEAAYFQPGRIRKGRTVLGLRTESSIRFEKGVDPQGVVMASDRAAHLMQELAGGSVVGQPKTIEWPKKIIPFSSEQINKLLGAAIPESEMVSILGRLGFEYKEASMIVPSWRQLDIQEWPCLAEEVARVWGFEKIGTPLPSPPAPLPGGEGRFESLLLDYGFYQVCTFPMIEAHDQDPGLALRNPIAPEESVMRASMLPSHVKVLEFNRKRQVEQLRIFEIGKVFKGQDEETHLSALWMGGCDFLELKGLVENIVGDVVFGECRSVELHPKKALSVNGDLGVVGFVHPSLLRRYDLDGDVGYISLNLAKMPAAKKKTFRPIPKFPSTRRDIALLTPRSLKYAEIEKVILENKPKWVKEFFLFDVFESEKIGKENKSLAFAFIYQDPERTLSDEEVNGAHQQFSATLKEKLPVSIR